jgi:hypothetical protein
MGSSHGLENGIVGPSPLHSPDSPNKQLSIKLANVRRNFRKRYTFHLAVGGVDIET